MDTRSKILTLATAGALPHPLTLVAGYFDVLRAEHAVELQRARDRTPTGKLLVAVISCPGEWRDAQSRTELVAALRMVDYVVTANHDDLDEFIGRLQPVAIVRLETADLHRRLQLIEDVQRRHHR